MLRLKDFLGDKQKDKKFVFYDLKDSSHIAFSYFCQHSTRELCITKPTKLLNLEYRVRNPN